MSTDTHTDPYSPIAIGSIWATRTRRHRAQLRRVVRLSASGRYVYLQTVGRTPRQHVGQTYHVRVDAFLIGMVPTTPNAA
jgi:hypothetical protein